MNQDLVNQAIKKLAQEASKTARMNSITASMRFGGKYTNLGMEKAEKESILNAMDLMKSKELIGRYTGVGYGQ